mmetsp:Transcript_104283/g.145307  ORF Transcript_104283/g.145307 Transcript_104283/m.145307 type:complete len:107 (-) Transcript_104283:497-817(-)
MLKLARTHKCNWKKISKKFTDIRVSPKFLKEKFDDYNERMAPKRKKFTHYEDLMIAKAFTEHGTDWEAISTYFENRRSPIMLKNRYYAFIRKNDKIDDLMAEVNEL